MIESDIVLELTIKEAKVLCRIIQNHNPSPEDEFTAIMLYSKIAKKIEEKIGKS